MTENSYVHTCMYGEETHFEVHIQCHVIAFMVVSFPGLEFFGVVLLGMYVSCGLFATTNRNGNCIASKTDGKLPDLSNIVHYP